MPIHFKDNTLNLNRYRALGTEPIERRKIYSGFYVPIIQNGCSRDYLLCPTYSVSGLTFELHEIDFDTIEREE